MSEQEKKEKRTCEERLPFTGKLCGRRLFDHKHCIFHSRDIKKKKNKFIDEFWKDFERQKEQEDIYNFGRFIFPTDISFVGKKITKKVDFTGAKFLGETKYCNVTFEGEVDFQGARFHEQASFISTDFEKKVNFTKARFSECVTFQEIKFNGNVKFILTKFVADRIVYFLDVNFSKEACFNSAHFSGDTNFVGKIDFENVNDCKMINTNFYNVDGLFDFISNNRGKFKCTEKTEFLPDNFRLILGEATMAKHPTTARMIQDDMYLLKFKEKHHRLYYIWWLFADCGRSIFRWTLWSIGFALFFAVIFYGYYLHIPGSFQAVYISKGAPFFSFFYYSIVTFTTLGFGDIVPKCGWLQLWVMLEVVLGYIMLGGLISILANKLARRS